MLRLLFSKINRQSNNNDDEVCPTTTKPSMKLDDIHHSWLPTQADPSKPTEDTSMADPTSTPDPPPTLPPTLTLTIRFMTRAKLRNLVTVTWDYTKPHRNIWTLLDPQPKDWERERPRAFLFSSEDPDKYWEIKWCWNKDPELTYEVCWFKGWELPEGFWVGEGEVRGYEGRTGGGGEVDE
ncbi:hypothetical protein EJ04DRAFT_586487 [Polyplosphaeria fusca]|uniref:Uncharacterized protein n=1 Tax=Polyplosphaeria fusca TaxID=682080 RepID=A0A9P4QSW8_9PLEO|nr:hypothetical protein EJ04DRAFT_586487 [Polyplosphaeria fusca]